MKEEQLELDVTVEQEYTLTLTESECNRISMLLGFVEDDPVVNNIHEKLERYVNEEYVENSFSKVYLRQFEILTGSHMLPYGKDIPMQESGYVLKIKD